MAIAFPTEQDRKLRQQPGKADLHASSKTYWSRLRNGKTCVRNNACTLDIENIYPGLKDLRLNPMWDLLGHPTMALNEVHEILAKLGPALDGKFITIGTSKSGIIFKRWYWNSGNAEQIESFEGFALKLALFRLSKLQPLDNAWLYSPKALTLHLLRLVTQKPWSHYADRLIRLLWIYIQSNDEGMTEKSIEQTLTDKEDRVFNLLCQRIYPEFTPSSSCLQSLQGYIQINRDLVQNFWRECFPESEATGSWRVMMETLFWADTHSDLWLHHGIPKEQLFSPGSPVFEEQYRTFFFGSRRRIW